MLVLQSLLLLAVLVMAALVLKNHLDYHRIRPIAFGAEAPLVSVLVPARNEATNIVACLDGLLAQDYPNFEILVLDDGSTDGTGDLARRLLEPAGAGRVLQGAPLPHGWAGKCHACAQLAAAARGEWLVFVDADTRHSPTLVRSAITAVRQDHADFLSTFPRQETGSLGEALVVPLMYWVLFTLLPLGRIGDDPNPALSAACGQFLLVRRGVYEATGGHAALRDSLHDGLHLARLFKHRGHRIALADLSAEISCRMYRGWKECWNGFTRNAYQAFGSYAALGAILLIEAALYLFPFASAAAAVGREPLWSGVAAASALIVLGALISLKLRFGFPWATVVLFPAGVALLMAIQICSAWRHWRGQPVQWKGRTAIPARN